MTPFKINFFFSHWSFFYYYLYLFICGERDLI